MSCFGPWPIALGLKLGDHRGCRSVGRGDWSYLMSKKQKEQNWKSRGEGTSFQGPPPVISLLQLNPTSACHLLPTALPEHEAPRVFIYWWSQSPEHPITSLRLDHQLGTNSSVHEENTLCTEHTSSPGSGLLSRHNYTATRPRATYELRDPRLCFLSSLPRLRLTSVFLTLPFHTPP